MDSAVAAAIIAGEVEADESSLTEDHMLHDDFRTLQEAFYGCQEAIEELQISHLRYVESLKEEIKECLKHEMIEVAQYIDKQNETIEELKGHIKSLSSHLSYYKRKAAREELDQSPKSLPLSEAIVATVNDLINSKQWYKLLSPKNKSSAVAKAVFHPNFANGIAHEYIINQS